MSDYQTVWPLYRKLGWAGVLPLPRNAKWPPPSGFTGRAGEDPTPEQCVRFEEDRRYRGTTQTALRMPATVTGLDVDNYDERGGADTIREAERRWGPLPSGPWSSARRDGSGIRYFRIPAGTRLLSEVKFSDLGLAGVEVVQRGHRYSVSWPSVHPKIRDPYTWRGTFGPDQPPHVDELPELPAAWLAGLDPNRHVAQAPVAIRPGPQPALVNARVNGILRRVTAAEPGQRNNLLSWGAGRLFLLARDGELDSAAAEELLHDAGRLIHLSPGEATATIRSARRWVFGG